MMLALPDSDIKNVNFFKIRNEISSILLSVDKISFLIFYDFSLRVAFESYDNNFSIFLNNFRNIYPVSYQVYGSAVKKVNELFFKRNAVFPLIPRNDVLSFIANNIELKKQGFFIIEIERSKIPLAAMKKLVVRRFINKTRNSSEKEIGKEVMKKLSLPIYRVRMYSSDPEIMKIAYDFKTGQGLTSKGKKIFMNTYELAYFIHYPMSLNSLRRPW
ncbi:MAG: hypothetical protein ACP5F1_00130 [Thermoplasmata archaeon]|nr:hypothetical protein [Thermoplasmata archaeon]